VTIELSTLFFYLPPCSPTPTEEKEAYDEKWTFLYMENFVPILDHDTVQMGLQNPFFRGFHKKESFVIDTGKKALAIDFIDIFDN
jgi:hypothetical protein